MIKTLIVPGDRFGSLKAVRRIAKTGEKTRWEVKCDCGNDKVVWQHCLVKGETKSCGCLRRKLLTTHGHTGSSHKLGKSATYICWQNMIQRCEYKKAVNYSRYGGAGVKVCRRWRIAFDNFLKDMGEKPEGMTIDRKNGKLGYFPSNCRWATRREQQNNMRTNVLISIDGVSSTISKWAELFGVVSRGLAGSRISRGWDPKKAFTTPSLTVGLNRSCKTRKLQTA